MPALILIEKIRMTNKITCDSEKSDWKDHFVCFASYLLRVIWNWLVFCDLQIQNLLFRTQEKCTPGLMTFTYKNQNKATTWKYQQTIRPVFSA